MEPDPRLLGPPRINSRVKFSDKEIAARAGRLKRIRFKMKMTQKVFSARLGISSKQYSLRETGKICPSDTEMILAELLNLLDNQERSRKHSKAYRKPETKKAVISMYLQEDISPEQIARRLGIRPDIAVWHIDNLDFDEEDDI